MNIGEIEADELMPNSASQLAACEPAPWVQPPMREFEVVYLDGYGTQQTARVDAMSYFGKGTTATFQIETDRYTYQPTYMFTKIITVTPVNEG